MMSLSDEALAMLVELTRPLSPALRSKFLAEVGERLRREPEIGEGAVFRAVARVQGEFFFLLPATAAAVADDAEAPDQPTRRRTKKGGGGGASSRRRWIR